MPHRTDELTTPAFRSQREPAPTPSDAAVAGLRIGDYVVKRVLGEGGMGIVYLADQVEPIERPVALKLIRAQLHDTMAAAQFEIERRALARMDHPAIARVYECGTTDDGFPFLAMQWIDGPPLHQHVRSTRPSLRARVALLAEVARGVAHAHARGILHRDLKPANILVARVDGRIEPKIIDFGIATGIGNDAAATPRVGTPGFMSPEQAGVLAEPVTPRSDVYALGMCLIDVLDDSDASRETGAPLTLLHALLHDQGDPTVARQYRMDEWPEDLKAILRCATAFRPEQRYASAGAFADDLDRFLASHPVSVRAATPGYRALRFVQRNPLPVVAATLVLAALLGGLAFALHGMRRAEAEAEKSRVLAGFLSEVLSGVQPDKARALDKTLMRLVLDNAATRARERLATQPTVLASIEEVIANSYHVLGEYTLSLAFQRAAYERRRDRDGAAATATLKSGRRLVQMLTDQGELKEAQQVGRELLAAAQRALGPDAAETLRMETTLAYIARDLGDLDEAKAGIERVLARLPESTDDEELAGDRREAQYVQAIVLTDRQEFAAAEPIYRELLAWHRRVHGEGAPKVLALQNSVGSLLLSMERWAEAEPLLRETLALHERMYGATHVDTLGVLGNLATSIQEQGRLAEAMALQQRVHEGFAGSVGADHPYTLLSRHYLALAHYQIDANDPEAMRLFDLALDEDLRVLGPRRPITLELLGDWVRAKRAAGREPEVAARLDALLQRARKERPDGHPSIATIEQLRAPPAVTSPPG